MGTKEKTTLSLDPEIKREGTAALHAMGLNLTTFVEMGLRATINEGRLPFVCIEWRPERETRCQSKDS